MLPPVIRFELQILSIGLFWPGFGSWLDYSATGFLFTGFSRCVPGLAYPTGMDICVLGEGQHERYTGTA